MNLKFHRNLLLQILFLSLVSPALRAQVVIEPGDLVVAVPPGTSGEISTLFIDCLLCNSAHSPSKLRAVARRDLPGDSRIALFMSREFEVSPLLAESEVDGLIRSSFDLVGTLGALGSLSRSLYDIGVVLIDKETGQSIAAETVASSLRQGSSVSVTPPGSPVGFPVPDPQSDLVDTAFTHHLRAPLRRGHRYEIRINFEVKAQVEDSILDPIAITAFAGSNFFQGQRGLTWNNCLVSLAPDDFERITDQIAAHDAAAAAQLAQHDADIKSELADIKGELGDIREQLDRIERLLLTPQGRRPGFPLKSERRRK
ncbi:MAG TPA: hypothetical protein VLS27_02925 [Gammaproteobacteria bacterium]|nr:hypothetical protein [Gammaproteobacteria bacterium]